MQSFRFIRLAACVLIALTALTLLPAPAKAAIASGGAKGGRGYAGCDGSVSCTAFSTSCTWDTPVKDIDASVRPVKLGGIPHVITWSAKLIDTLPNRKALVVLPFNAQCDLSGNQVVVPRSGAQISLPASTAYISVVPFDPFTDFTWTLH